MDLYAVIRKDYFIFGNEFQYEICGIFDTKKLAEDCVKYWGSENGENIAHIEKYTLNNQPLTK